MGCKVGAFERLFGSSGREARESLNYLREAGVQSEQPGTWANTFFTTTRTLKRRLKKTFLRHEPYALNPEP